MSVSDGRRMHAKRHARYSEDQLPPADTDTARAALRYRAARGDHLATMALAEWEKTQREPAPPSAGGAPSFEASAGDTDDLGDDAA
jgi:hypothetical protein